jgi:hypothetical protein
LRNDDIPELDRIEQIAIFFGHHLQQRDRKLERPYSMFDMGSEVVVIAQSAQLASLKSDTYRSARIIKRLEVNRESAISVPK